LDIEMSWVDRINGAILRRIAGKATLLADEQGIEQSGQRFAYAELQRAVAFREPNLIGDALSVALDFGAGRIIVVSENEAAWQPILASLDAHPRNRRSSSEWSLALVAGGDRIELL
jgi:hypothetical protein